MNPVEYAIARVFAQLYNTPKTGRHLTREELELVDVTGKCLERYQKEGK